MKANKHFIMSIQTVHFLAFRRCLIKCLKKGINVMGESVILNKKDLASLMRFIKRAVPTLAWLLLWKEFFSF